MKEWYLSSFVEEPNQRCERNQSQHNHHELDKFRTTVSRNALNNSRHKCSCGKSYHWPYVEKPNPKGDALFVNCEGLNSSYWRNERKLLLESQTCQVVCIEQALIDQLVNNP